jgi:nucleoside recognition membrane protein YjiH
MIPLTALWLPIVISAVLAFAASAVMHMVLPFHRKDYKVLPDEDKVRAAIREAKVPEGNYFFPHATDLKEARTPEMMAKFEEGPVGLMNVMPSGPPTMGKALGIWFVFCLVVSVFVAYLTTRTLGPGTSYLAVFRIAGTVAFMGYGLSECTNSIWKAQAWSTTVKSLVDAFIYGLLTAGVFGWLWPQ